MAELLADADEFLQDHLWHAETAGPGRDALAKHGIEEKTARAFGVGYAPVGHSNLMDHLEDLGYSREEVVAAGLARTSARGRVHAHFRSRVMFPVRNRNERILGFAGLATHVGPSWPLWVTSPDTDLYRRSEAVYGIDRAGRKISSSGTALIGHDCLEVLRAHQDGQANAVCVHTGEVTRAQMTTMAGGMRGGLDALELDLPPGMRAEPKHAPPASAASGAGNGRARRPAAPAAEIRHGPSKRIAIVAATAFLAVSAWTTAPLFAVWVGSRVQGGQVLSIWGVLSVLVVFAILVFLIAWGLTWLSAKYDQLTGRPRIALETSPWHRAKRGDRVQDIRSRFGISVPERIVAGSVIAAVVALQIWFFLYAGAPF